MKHKNLKNQTFERYVIIQKLYNFCKNGMTIHKIY